MTNSFQLLANISKQLLAFHCTRMEFKPERGQARCLWCMFDWGGNMGRGAMDGEEWIGAIEEGGECNAIREVQAIEERRGKAAFP